MLQRKLKESHQNFDRHVVDFCAKTADGLSKEMKRVAQNIGTAQSSVQVLFNSILHSQFDVLNFIIKNFIRLGCSLQYSFGS